MKKDVVALLPMKGNSERVPNKNIKDFNGKPLFYYMLKSLLSSNYISYVVVNTDSDNIANKVQNLFPKNVIIEKRPNEICGDFVSMNKIIEYDINIHDSKFYIQTHSTNPLLRSETIDNAIVEMKKLYNKGFDSIVSVNKLQSRFYDIENKPINHDPKNLVRTQDLTPIYEENSCFYIFTKNGFINAGKRRIGKKPYFFSIDKVESVDIDEHQDFVLAENIFKQKYKV